MAGHGAGGSQRAEQFDSSDDDLAINDWMAGRNAQIAWRRGASLAGRELAHTGQSANPSARTNSRGYNPDEPRDGHGRWTTGGATSSTHSTAQTTRTAPYGSLSTPVPSDPEMAELRRQQAALAKAIRELDIQNSWLAIPALVAPFVFGAPEEAAAWAAREVLPEAEQGPLDLPERDPYRRVGDNWATRKGRQAHAAFKQQVQAKEGWDPDPAVNRPGQRPLRPDAGTPARNPERPDKRFYVELKPDTPSGRARGASAVKRYQDASGNKTRVVYYDPKKIK